MNINFCKNKNKIVVIGMKSKKLKQPYFHDFPLKYNAHIYTHPRQRTQTKIYNQKFNSEELNPALYFYYQ